MIQELQRLEKEGYVRSARHPTAPLTIWCYTNKTQYDRHWTKSTREARGLVTDDQGNIVSRPVPKFFNIEELKDLGEHIPKNMDFTVFPKLDGSMIQMFYYNNSWIVTSKGSFTSNHAEMAKEVLLKENFDFGKLNKKYTYQLELTGQDNKIVVDYDWKRKLTLWAVLDKNGEDVPIRPFEGLFEVVESVYMYDADFDDFKGTINENEEGYVIRFENGFRFKVKGTWYIEMHKIITNCTYRDLWRVLSSDGDLDVYFENMPEEFTKWAYQKIGELTVKYKSIENKAKRFHEENKDKGWTRKDWALNSLHIQPQEIIFHILDGTDYSPYIWKTIYPEHEKAFEL